jgi:hypothetical protein
LVVLRTGVPFVARRRDGGYTDIQFNKPCPWEWREVLPKFDGISTGAMDIIEMGEKARILDRKRHPPALTLIVDHSVPLNVICRHLWATPKFWTIERLRSLLHKTFRRAVLSYAENALLDERGLKSKMPQGWRVGDDPFDRYKDAGITLVD